MTNLTMRKILIPVENKEIEASLRVPVFADAVVIIATTASSPTECVQSTRLALELCEDGCASIVVNFDAELLDPLKLSSADHDTAEVVHRVSQLLIGASTAVHRRHDLKGWPIGYFAQDLAAAAAIRSASILGHMVSVAVFLDAPIQVVGNELRSLASPTLFLISPDRHELYSQTKDLIRVPHSVLQLPSSLTPTPADSNENTDEILSSTTAWFRTYFPRHTHWKTDVIEQKQR